MSIEDKIFEKLPWAKKIYDYLYVFSDRLDKHHVFMLASGIAFNIIIYIIPLILVAIFVISIFLSESEINLYISKIFSEWLPPTEGATKILNAILKEVQSIDNNSSLFGIIGLVGLLWVSSFLISSLRTSLNAVFQLDSDKIFLVYRLKDIMLTVLLSVLVVVYSYIVPIINYLQSLLNVFLPDFLEGFVTELILTLISAGTSFAVFYIIFAFVPNKKLPRYVVILSTILSVVLIEVSRRAFGWYISSLSNYGKFYGTYAVIVSHALWIYYSSLIILISAEFSQFTYDRKHRQLEDCEDFLVEKKTSSKKAENVDEEKSKSESSKSGSNEPGCN